MLLLPIIVFVLQNLLMLSENFTSGIKELPVLAYYSDCFPHKEDTKKDKSKKKIGKLRNFGYFDWNGVEGCTKEWISRLENNIFSIRQSKDLIAKLNIAQNENNNEIIAIKTKEVEQLQHENDVIEDCIKRLAKIFFLKISLQ